MGSMGIDTVVRLHKPAILPAFFSPVPQTLVRVLPLLLQSYSFGRL